MRIQVSDCGDRSSRSASSWTPRPAPLSLESRFASSGAKPPAAPDASGSTLLHSVENQTEGLTGRPSPGPAAARLKPRLIISGQALPERPGPAAPAAVAAWRRRLTSTFSVYIGCSGSLMAHTGMSLVSNHHGSDGDSDRRPGPTRSQPGPAAAGHDAGPDRRTTSGIRPKHPHHFRGDGQEAGSATALNLDC